MALASAADAYVGSFDETGCAAVITGRPAFLLGGENGVRPAPADLDDLSVWFPDLVDPTEARNVALQFLSRHFEQKGSASVINVQPGRHT